MTPEQEIAWAAGLFEGEGSFGTGASGRFTARLAMTDRDVVERFCSIVGVGQISTRPERLAHRLPLWDWGVSGDAAVRVAEMLLPYLGERRTRTATERLAARAQHRLDSTTERSCPNCSETFTPPYSKQASRRIFCSKRCTNLYHGRAAYHRRKLVAAA